MRKLLLALGVALFAFIIYGLLKQDPGYVLIARPPKSIEMTLTAFTVIAVLAIVVFYLIGRLIAHGFNIPKEVAGWRKRRFEQQARVALTAGLNSLAACDWEKAEVQLVAGLQHSEAPMLNYLAAAIAAQGTGDIKKRDQYLYEAGKAAPKDSLATGMTQAFLQHLAKQREQALATLTELRNRAPENKAAINLLKDTYLELDDWTGLMHLLPDLKKYKAVDKDEYHRLEVDINKALLTLSLPSGSLDVLQQAWGSIPKPLKSDPQIIALYAGKLIAQGEHDSAEKLLRTTLEQEWQPELVTLYGDTVSQNIGKQLEMARSWLISRSKDVELLTTLGKLSLENGETEAALDYLKQALALRKDAAVYLQLGRASERAHDHQKAMEYYRQGLVLASTKGQD